MRRRKSKAVKRQKNTKIGPKPSHPRHLERKYNGFLRSVLSQYRDAMRQFLVPALGDIVQQAEQTIHSDGDIIEIKHDVADQISAIMATIKNWVNNRLPPAQQDDEIKQLAHTINQHNITQMRRVTQSKSLPGQQSTEELIKLFVQNNQSLTESLQTRLLQNVVSLLHAGVSRGLPKSALAANITKQFGIAQRRAKNISRNEVGTLNGQLTKVRQQNIGVKQYIWRTSEDERVRGNPSGLYPNARYSHYARNNKVFNWNSPPPDGNPGEAYNCRCIAQPVIPDDVASDT